MRVVGGKDRHDPEAIKKAVEVCGSISGLARALGSSPVSVHEWLRGSHVPSPLSCIKIEKATKKVVTKEEIRPDFDWKNFKLI